MLLGAEKDYYKIFPDRDPNRDNAKEKSTREMDDGEKIYEVGTDGTVDISS